MKYFIILTVILLLKINFCYCLKTDKAEGRKWFDEYDKKESVMSNAYAIAHWNHDSNITDYNAKLAELESIRYRKFFKKMTLEAIQFDWQSWEKADPELHRYFKMITEGAIVDEIALNKSTEASAIAQKMSTIYGKAEVCEEKGTCLSLEPGLTKLFRKSRDYDKLLWAWKGWRSATKSIGTLYPKFVELQNEVSNYTGYNNTAESWLSNYESTTFKDDLEDAWQTIKPFYDELHAYVRRHLRKIYKREFSKGGHIPAHLLGNMWAQSWTSLYNDIRPFQGKESVDVTEEMIKQNYNASVMFHLADEFFTSLGLEPATKEFWENSIIEKPSKDWQMICHASAWDFSDGRDFRIKQCTEVNMADLETVHHEMGHIQYYLQYKDLPSPFRTGANPGFHEAIGDLIALSVSTPSHMKKIGLLKTVENDKEADINYLLLIALTKIAFIPFGYFMDQYRWDIFEGKIKPEEYNEKWWELRCKYQGVYSPIARNKDDFDPGAKYHIAANVPYIRYYVSSILQFQLHDALCKEAGLESIPLHQCDIYQSKAAGKKLGDLLRLGGSKPWKEALKSVTGTEKLDTTSILRYFQPLYDCLKEDNKKHGETATWDPKCPEFGGSSTVKATTFLQAIGILLFAFIQYR